MDANAPKITARKATVTKQGVRGEKFRKTVYKPVINGQIVQLGFPTAADAIAYGETRAARHAN
jgi:hypothetical protein